MGGHSLQIGPVGEQDLNQVLAVYHQCEDFLALGPEPRASRAMVRQDIELARRDGGVFCGIRAAGSLIGVVEWVPAGWEGDPAAAFLALLMIGRPYRRRGIGAEVVAHVENEIRRDPNVAVILSGVQVNNPQAIAFWQRMGYEIAGGPELLPDRTTVFRLRKTIEAQGAR